MVLGVNHNFRRNTHMSHNTLEYNLPLRVYLYSVHQTKPNEARGANKLKTKCVKCFTKKQVTSDSQAHTCI